MIVFELYDLDTGDTITDLTEFGTGSVAVGVSAPTGVEFTLPGDTEGIIGTHDDGYPILQVGRRGLKATRDSTLVANTILRLMSAEGDEETTTVKLTGHDPLSFAGARFAYDLSGNLGDPDFGSPVSGPSILQQAFQGSISVVGELPLNVDDGTFEDGVDLSALLENFPMSILDLMALLVATRTCDVVVQPTDDSPDSLGTLNAYQHFGSDLSGTVHFDYATGDHSIAKIRRLWDLGILCNRLWYFLGRRLDPNHFDANITATELSPYDLSAYATLQLDSRDKYLWTYEDVRIFNFSGPDAYNRALMHELWKAEVTLRTNERQMLYLTPMRGEGCPFHPWDDYFIGDTVAANVGEICGPPLEHAQLRIYGFTVTQEPDGPEQVSELAASPDGLA